MENRQFESMFAVARARLARHAPEDIAEKAGVRYADGAFQIPTLGQTAAVRLPDCTIEPPLSNWHALTLLHLLDLADGTPLTGRTITLSQYKDGLVRGSGLDRNAELIVRRDLGGTDAALQSTRRGALALQRRLLRTLRLRPALSHVAEDLVRGRGISRLRPSPTGRKRPALPDHRRRRHRLLPHPGPPHPSKPLDGIKQRYMQRQSGRNHRFFLIIRPKACIV